MTDFIHQFSKQLIDFILVFVFSLLIGLEQGRHFQDKSKITFGTDRTFTFIGLLGFILCLLPSPIYFAAGMLGVSALLVAFYYGKVQHRQGYGLTSTMLALTVYSMPLLVVNQPHWLALTLYILLLLLAELKGAFRNLSDQIDKDEFFTLGKFLLMAAVILPALPHTDINQYLPVSPYKIWLAIVVISGISYASYLIKKYLFPRAGLLVTGILGGLYSSTATTFIMARNSKEEIGSPNQYAAAILVATAMMFLRIFILIVIFAPPIAFIVWPYFLSLFAISLAVTAWTYSLKSDAKPDEKPHAVDTHLNPLEFKIAMLFAALYIIFTLATHYTLQYFGTGGLTVLSFLVGFTDIDPFLLNLFQGTHTITNIAIGIATLQAVMSNNLLKMIYGMFLCDKNVRRMIGIGFGIIIAGNIIAMLLMYFLAK